MFQISTHGPLAPHHDLLVQTPEFGYSPSLTEPRVRVLDKWLGLPIPSTRISLRSCHVTPVPHHCTRHSLAPSIQWFVVYARHVHACSTPMTLIQYGNMRVLPSLTSYIGYILPPTPRIHSFLPIHCNSRRPTHRPWAMAHKPRGPRASSTQEHVNTSIRGRP